MTRSSPSRAFRYEVVVSGEYGPALRATFSDMGADEVDVSSIFLVQANAGVGIPDIAAMLHARGLGILDIRRVATRPTRPPQAARLTEWSDPRPNG